MSNDDTLCWSSTNAFQPRKRKHEIVPIELQFIFDYSGPEKIVEMLLLLLHELKFSFFFGFREPMSEPHNGYCYVTAPLFNYIGLIVFGVYFFCINLLFLLSCGSFPYNLRLCQSQSVCHVYHVLRFVGVCFIFFVFHDFSSRCSIIIGVGNVQCSNSKKIEKMTTIWKYVKMVISVSQWNYAFFFFCGHKKVT